MNVKTNVTLIMVILVTASSSFGAASRRPKKPVNERTNGKDTKVRISSKKAYPEEIKTTVKGNTASHLLYQFVNHVYNTYASSSGRAVRRWKPKVSIYKIVAADSDNNRWNKGGFLKVKRTGKGYADVTVGTKKYVWQKLNHQDVFVSFYIPGRQEPFILQNPFLGQNGITMARMRSRCAPKWAYDDPNQTDCAICIWKNNGHMWTSGPCPCPGQDNYEAENSYPTRDPNAVISMDLETRNAASPEKEPLYINGGETEAPADEPQIMSGHWQTGDYFDEDPEDPNNEETFFWTDMNDGSDANSLEDKINLIQLVYKEHGEPNSIVALDMIRDIVSEDPNDDLEDGEYLTEMDTSLFERPEQYRWTGVLRYQGNVAITTENYIELQLRSKKQDYVYIEMKVKADIFDIQRYDDYTDVTVRTIAMIFPELLDDQLWVREVIVHEELEKEVAAVTGIYGGEIDLGFVPATQSDFHRSWNHSGTGYVHWDFVHKENITFFDWNLLATLPMGSPGIVPVQN
jgi:hypothetical protein